MKKLSILLIGLLLVTGFAVAQDVAITGSATLTFGIDLDTNQTGFKNEATSTVDLAWLGGDAEAGTEGWIKLAGWAISFEETDTLKVTAGTVTAGWMFDPLTITIYSAPSFSGGEAKGIGYEGADPVKDIVTVGLTAANAAPGFQGLTIDVALGVADLTLLVASDGTWVENAANDYVVGAEIGATAGPATIAAGVYAGPLSGTMVIDADLGVDLVVGPATVALGFDLSDLSGTLAWDAQADIGLDVAGIGVDIGTYIYTPAADLELDADVMLDLSALVEALTFTELFQMQALLAGGTLDWYSKTTLGYAVSDQVSVGAVFEIDDASVIDLEGTVTLTGFVENTVFTLKYAVDDLGPSTGAITFAAKITLP